MPHARRGLRRGALGHLAHGEVRLVVVDRSTSSGGRGSVRSRVLVARPLRLPLAELRTGDRLVATLDGTGGFYSRQRWSGVAPPPPRAPGGGPPPATCAGSPPT